MLSWFSPVRLFATVWTVARQAPLSMGFSRQDYWSGLSCSPPANLPNPDQGSNLFLLHLHWWVLYHWRRLGSLVICILNVKCLDHGQVHNKPWKGIYCSFLYLCPPPSSPFTKNNDKETRILLPVKYTSAPSYWYFYDNCQVVQDTFNWFHPDVYPSYDHSNDPFASSLRWMYV